jgi:two-component system, chemotaxis family, CheB/CheR fusion protein
MAPRITVTSEALAAAWLAAIVESSDDAIVSKTLDGIITSWNPAAEKLFGYSAEEIIGRPIATLGPLDREDEMPAILERIRRGEKVDHFETVRRRKDGSLVDISLTVSPIHDQNGRTVGASKIARDITARKEAEERQRLLTRELSHRVKNMLAVVGVLAERSCAKATSVGACLETFRGRLRALGAAQNALIAGDSASASLTALVQTALDPHMGEDDRVRLDIRDVRIKPDLALSLALGLHELTTNAAKYGALSNPTGHITLTAHLARGGSGEELRLVWQEDGGPAVTRPAVTGFGTSMLSQAMQYQHKGTVEFDWRKEGLVCRLFLPLATSSPGSHEYAQVAAHSSVDHL